MSDAIIKVEHLSKSFRDNLVLDKINVEFEQGKIHGIIGRNGSGKTVLFKCICGFVPYTIGRIIVQGKQIGKDTEMPDDFSVIIETPGFLPQYSGYKNLKFLADLNTTLKKDDIYAVMEKVGLDPRSKKHVSKYSLGMRQRLGIAQAIQNDPSLMILDEPLSGLDKDGLQEMRELFLSFKEQGKTILIASHSSDDIDILCDTVHEIEKGVLTKIR